MIHHVSTFKSTGYSDNINNTHVSVAVDDLNFQTSTFGIFNHTKDCEDYYDFLEGLNELHSKVESGDLSDFTELKL